MLFYIINFENCNDIILVKFIGFANKIIFPILLIFKINILYK